MGNLLCSLVGEQPKQWDLTLPHTEFAYNLYVNHTTGKTLFVVVYGRNPFTPIDLVPLPMTGFVSHEGEDQSTQIKELHKQVRDQIIRHNERYQTQANKHKKRTIYKEGDLVWIHLCKERFHGGRFGKLKPHVDGLFRVLQHINHNAYKIEFPGHYNVSATFNVADLSPYEPNTNDDMELEASLFQAREDDAGASDQV